MADRDEGMCDGEGSNLYCKKKQVSGICNKKYLTFCYFTRYIAISPQTIK